MVAGKPVARDPKGHGTPPGLGRRPDGNRIDMFWLLVALTGWTLLALLAAPVVGRVLALDGRPPRRRPVHFHRPLHGVVHPSR